MFIRIKYEKTGPLKFIGHLDLMRTFQKLFRRALLPIAYSEGFNPHPIFSIAAPLSLGVVTYGDYFDLKLRQEMPLEPLINQLRAVCPEGLTILKGMVLEEKAEKGMAAVVAAAYGILGPFDALDGDTLKAYLSQESILVDKKTKKGKMKALDIKPGIYALERNEGRLDLLLSAGSTLNIKPELFLQTLCTFLNVPYDRTHYQIERQDCYAAIDPLTALIP